MATPPPFEPWSEPYTELCLKHESLCKMLPSYMLEAIEKEIISEKVLGYVALIYRKVEEGERHGMATDVAHDDGTTEDLFSLCCRFLEHSYKMTSSKYDLPQVAIQTINLLCVGWIVLQDNRREYLDCLLRLASIDVRAGSRVLMFGIAAGLSLKGRTRVDTRFGLFFFVYDLRMLLERKHTATAGILVNCAERLGGVETVDSDAAMELLYLISEYYLAIGDYSKVKNVREKYSPIWKLYEKDPRGLEIGARRVKLCIARAFELTGSLQEARDIYKSCGESSNEGLEASLDGKQVYLFQKLNFPIENLSNRAPCLNARQLPDGKLAIFFARTNGDKIVMNFNIFDPDTNSLIESELPHQGFKWRRIIVVESSPSSLLRVLVAPRNIEQDQDVNGDFMQEIYLSQISCLRVDDALPIEKTELWEYYHETGTWRELKTRGSIPELFLPVSRCVMTNQNSIVLFGGNDHRSTNQSSVSETSSAGVFILDMDSFVWQRITHPYKYGMKIEVTSSEGTIRDTIHRSLPPFSGATEINLDGRNWIALLREGYCERTRGMDNETIPKFALDIFGLPPSLPVSGRLGYSWKLGVETSDRAGYIAPLLTHFTCVSSHSTILTIGSNVRSGFVQKEQPDGAIQVDMGRFLHSAESKAQIAVLDLASMEWRGVNIYNFELLDGTDPGRPQLVKSSNPNSCYLITLSSTALKVFEIANLSALRDCYTKPVSTWKLQSKKQTLSYQVAKAEKNRVKPLRVCASCMMLENKDKPMSFKCCSRCRVPFYCSKLCQRNHWKREHKQECISVAETVAEPDPPSEA